ncbi:MAG: hypothetical protein ACREFP_09675 [Acetobacteraceae bacterium]
MSEAVMTTHGAASASLPVVRRGLAEALLGAAAAILGIIGLALAGHTGAATATSGSGVPLILDSVAVIVLGICLAMVGSALLESYARLLTSMEGTNAPRDSVAGTTVDFFLGTGIVVLGVLALLHVVGAVLVPVAFILIGAGFVLNSTASVRMIGIATSESGAQSAVQRLRGEMAMATFGVRVIAGLATIVLGILAVVGIAPLELTLIAAIVAGAAVTASVTSVPGRLARGSAN